MLSDYFNPICYAPWKGPIPSSLVLGGFSGSTNFEEATAVIITFTVNNYYNPELLQPALKWEKK